MTSVNRQCVRDFGLGFLAGLCEIIFTMLMDAERNLCTLPSKFATLEAPQKAKNKIII